MVKNPWLKLAVFSLIGLTVIGVVQFIFQTLFGTGFSPGSQSFGPGMMGRGPGMGMGSGMMSGSTFSSYSGSGLNLITSLLITAAIIWILVGLIGFMYNNSKGFLTKLQGKEILNSSNDSSLEILKERYARGELSRDEYLKIREDLV